MFLLICKPIISSLPRAALLLGSVCVLVGMGIVPSAAKETVSFAGDVAQSEASQSRAKSVQTVHGTVHDAKISAFYSQRGGKMFWHASSGRLSSNARSFIKTIEDSWTHGLNPETFHLSALTSAQDSELSPAARDILLTDAFVRYVRSISGMRVPAQELGLRPKDWLQSYSFDEALSYMERVRHFDRFTDKIIPKSGTYKRLRRELIEMVESGADLSASKRPLHVSKRLVRPGQVHSMIPAVRDRLGVAPQTENEKLYDDRLAGAVMKFQREHGLGPDGIIGQQTVYMLNQGERDRYLQIIANMERLRWKPEAEADRFVVVNIPSATLWAVDGGALQFEMPVVIGRPKRQTKSFITHINGVRINPDWTLPPTVKKEDIVPASINNPGYLSKKGIQVYSGYGRNAVSLDPASIDWANMTQSRLSSLRMVQPPSSRNPLGQFRVLMPNQYNIYLHDTNNKRAFDSSVRAISSGCVRMSEPRKLTEFVMEGSQWTPEKLQEVLERGKKRDLMIEDPVPVYLFYFTVWIDHQGKLVFGHDIYERDKLLIKYLEDIDGFIIPVHT